MDISPPSELLTDRAFYSLHFMDLALWEPFVRRSCERHGWGCARVTPGLPGTYPTFVVKLEPIGSQPPHQSALVKFFGSLFDGATSFQIEKEMGHWLAQQTLPVRSPAILADDQLDQDWSYLIFEAIQGVSIGQVRTQLSFESWAGVAEQMGAFIKALHTAIATGLPEIKLPFSTKDWSGFAEFLELQRATCHANHQRWDDLPQHLLPQVQDYLLPVDQLLDSTSLPHLIHADLTSDHLMGRLVSEAQLSSIDPRTPSPAGAGWETQGIIDWGDTRIGNILYELVALYLDLFQADKRLLRICLDHYGLPDFYRQDFPHKALCMVLLHQFPMPARVYEPHREAATLDMLAEDLFGL